MKFLADENFPFSSASVLRCAGHDVTHVSEIASGSPDEDVVALANKDGLTILTFDSDIGTLAIARSQPCLGGIVYFRLFSYKPDTPGYMLLDYLAANPEVDLSERITVFDPPRVRQRKFE
jgi:predicted nuclease of predicted toxin-antitoxin system